MTGNADTLKEFLIGLGFNVDEAGLKKFTGAVGSATVAAVAVGAACITAASAVVYGIHKIADNYFELDRLATRFRSTAQAIEEFENMAQIMGISKDVSVDSLKSLDKAIADTAMGIGRAKKVFASIDLKVVDSSGKMRPTLDVMDDLAIKFNQMERGRALNVMRRLGLDEGLLKLFNADMAQLRKDLDEINRAAGFDLSDVIKQSQAFTWAWRAVTQEIEKGRILFSKMVDAVASKIMPRMTQGLKNIKLQLEDFRKYLMGHMVDIQRGIESTVNFLLSFFSVVGKLLGTALGLGIDAVKLLVGWFSNLDGKTQALIVIIGVLTAAWKWLNLAFMASPIGRLLMLALALVALYDDFKTYNEGGYSAIDWGNKWVELLGWVVPLLIGIGLSIGVLTTIWTWCGAIWTKVGFAMAAATGSAFWPIVLALVLIAALAVGAYLVIKNWEPLKEWFRGFWKDVMGWLDDIINKAKNLVPSILSDVAGGIAASVGVTLPQQFAAPGIGALPALAPSFSAANAIQQMQQSIDQKTNINVYSSGDPIATGRAVAGEQGRVNQDMCRIARGVNPR